MSNWGQSVFSSCGPKQMLSWCDVLFVPLIMVEGFGWPDDPGATQSGASGPGQTGSVWEIRQSSAWGGLWWDITIEAVFYHWGPPMEPVLLVRHRGEDLLVRLLLMGSGSRASLFVGGANRVGSVWSSDTGVNFWGSGCSHTHLNAPEPSRVGIFIACWGLHWWTGS